MSQLLQPIGVAVVALGLLLGAARPTQAALILTMEEVGGDVVVEGSGTANLDALVFAGFVLFDPSVTPSLSRFAVGASPLSHLYSTLSGPADFGPGGLTFADTASGDHFGLFQPNVLLVPFGYVSGATLSGASVYAGHTFASLEVIPGTYMWTWGTGANADSLTLQIGPPAVPEPVSLSLLAVGVAGLGLRRWRRRTA